MEKEVVDSIVQLLLEEGLVSDTEEVESRMRLCVQRARELEALKKSDEDEFNRLITYLKSVAQRIGSEDSFMPVMAMAILEELEIDSTSVESREKVTGVLKTSGAPPLSKTGTKK
ncbi:hypothetical protein JXD20_03980 [Candidatus Peregrinibacteria bacterium]|nr:hypothetical protein [Candidatus Peregrinibacteria bacterium]